MAAWSAYVSNNDKARTRNPVSRLLFDSNRTDTATRSTRAMAAGEVCVPTKGVKTFVTHTLDIMNSCAELRDAPTKAKANKAATTIAKNAPL
jgi:hypothetical protein